MEDVKIRVNGKKLDTDCICPKYATDTINKWKNEIWKVYDGMKNLIYFKNKTWRNCWVKYNLVTPPKKRSTGEESLYINYWNGAPSNQYKFPTITDIQDYVENGGSLAHAMKQAVNPRELAEELYKCHSNIDWSKWYHSNPRTYNFLGSQWFTHAWDSKGVNLGDIGWNRQWNFNFSGGESRYGIEDAPDATSLDLKYAFAGSNLLNVNFTFHGNTFIHNAKGMFKALQVNPNITCKNEDGERIYSSKYKGIAPLDMSEMFKQAWETREIPNCIYYDNCHSISGFVFDSWNIHTIKPNADCRVGEEREGNILTPAYPDGTGIFPNTGRINWKGLGHAVALRVVGPLLNMRYVTDTTFFDNSSNIEEMYIKHLNGVGGTRWDFTHMKKLKPECIKYLLDNLWDRRKNYRPYTEENKREVVNQTLVLHKPPVGMSAMSSDSNSPTIVFPQEWVDIIEKFRGQGISEEMRRLHEKGWKMEVKWSNGRKRIIAYIEY